jgi:hypothetical protein
LYITLSATHRVTAMFISFNMRKIHFWNMISVYGTLFFWDATLRHSIPVTGTWCIWAT